MDHSICVAEGCPYFGRYCRIHKSVAPKPLKGGLVKTQLDKWFDKKIKKCNWICEECSANCYSNDRLYQRAAQAHILPKALFPSLATHEYNHLVLGPACGCHARYDSNWANASKMKIWPQVKGIMYTMLIPLLWPEEYRKLPDIIADGYEDFSRSLIAKGELDNRQTYVRKVYLNLKRK